ncbi:bifunctional enoyl-CoA hydratase/phosphate acetyltransferase [Rhodovulum sp. DZ06]|uniref:bifunctional enoyl-CoA hydratase/phosphate acetyltransferase n=1 Tax=Rhodovulum sp. DZ06 TaxID=3425126 RepID=UPI003D350923
MKLSNKTWDELEIGQRASLNRTATLEDFYVFANASGNMNPLHLPKHDGDGDGDPEAIAPAMWVGSLVSSVLGNLLPGPGTVYLGQQLHFHNRVHAGDPLTISVEVVEKRDGGEVLLDTCVEIAGGVKVASGVAEVRAPTKKLVFDDVEAPHLMLERHKHFDALLERAGGGAPMPVAVAAPEKGDALAGPVIAAKAGLIRPILVGDPDAIAAAAKAEGLDISGMEIVPAPHHPEAAEAAVDLVREGRAQALMKGHLHTDDLMHAVLRKENGLRAGRRLSHVFVMDVPGREKLLFVTDAAINIAPDLATKKDIVQNAIDLALALGIEEPKVGLLSAVETVTPSIPSTLDAAILSKMADRGQITGGLVDGPLAMDNAVDLGAAKTKGIAGSVAGRADILVAPNMEAGNMVAKELTFLARAEAGGIVVGAACPIILTSRADDEKARLASCAVAVLMARGTK